jgi:acetylcholinesterase
MRLAIPSLLSLTLLGRAATAAGPDDLTVRTSTGTYTGLVDPSFPRTRQFRAIPFAEPPVASRRWLPPQKLTSSPTEHHYATRFPPSCPQFMSAVPSYYNIDLTKGNLIYNGNQNDTSGLVGEATSEDCLYVAVWTPTTPPPDGGFPVLFFMTGGGNVQGGIDIPWQMPTSWVERSQSHIVVTINYRLSIFGFPNARGISAGHQNLGILDQRAALEWVRDNIAAFGGNPARITQMGRSAGATATDVHAYAYHEDPIAQGYYMQSGTIFSGARRYDTTYSNFTFVARHVGCDAPCGGPCPADDNGAAELDCMRRVSFVQIINFIGQYGDRADAPALWFNLVPDDHVVFFNYTARSEAGKIARVPAIISHTANEASALFPWSVDNPSVGPNQAVVNSLTVGGWVCPSLNSTVYRNRLGIPIFRIEYAGRFPNLNYYDWLGAYHASDIPITFGTYGLLDHIANTTSFEAEVSQSFQDHILAFVKDPYHGPQETLGWQPMIANDPNGGYIMRIGANGTAAQQIDGVEVDGVCLGLREHNPFP